MVKLRKRRFPSTYERQSLEDLESAASDAVDQLEREKAGTYRVVPYTGQPITVSICDLVVFRVPGSVVLPSPSPENAGKRVAIQCETGGTTSTASVVSGTINGVTTPYSLATANRIREFISNGTGWCSHA
jgi:type II secretory pathway pseudopilin PulG